MSIIAAGTTSGTALVSTGDTNGTLVIQTNGTTVAATFGTDQSLTVVGALSAPSIAGNAVATQAQQETGTSTTVLVTPGRQQFHPSAAKFWVAADPAGAITASYNVASITDGGVGILGVTIDTDFSSANWTGAAQVQENSNAMACKFSSVVAAGSCEVRAYTSTAGVLTDPNRFFVQGFGDQ